MAAIPVEVHGREETACVVVVVVGGGIVLLWRLQYL
jgi:hypothetical protein